MPRPLLVPSVLLALAVGLTVRADEEGAVQALEPSRPLVRRPFLRVERSIEIAAPVERVWAYVGDSTRAGEWSVYFHHLSPLPGPPDGTVGALRRCFRRADERGARWDERVAGIQRLQVRHILSFDFVDLPATAAARSDVWQLYEPLGPDRMRLTFRTAPARGSNLADRIAFAGARWRTGRVFRENLENIAAILEGRARPHPYEAP